MQQFVEVLKNEWTSTLNTFFQYCSTNEVNHLSWISNFMTNKRHYAMTYYILHYFSQDGSLCCSYNLHCNDNAVAVGFDGITVPSSSTQQHERGGTTQISNVFGQYTSSYSMDSSSVSNLYPKKSEQVEGVTVPAGG